MGYMLFFNFGKRCGWNGFRFETGKIYIHIDKPFYLTGDTIWMKGYLVDAKTHKEQDVQSRFMYVELIDNKNKVLLRKKLKEENGIYRNFFHWKVIFLKDSICYGVIQIICVMGMRLSFYKTNICM